MTYNVLSNTLSLYTTTTDAVVYCCNHFQMHPQVHSDVSLTCYRFSFIVVPNAFIIHQPHAPSLDIARYRANVIYRDCLKVFKSDFQRYLSRKYGIRALKYLTPDT